MRCDSLSRAISAAVLAAWLGACSGTESGPTGPDPASGGQERVLDYDTFVAAVAPVLAAEGCAAAGDCHGGGIRGAFALSPEHEKDLAFDFQQASEQINDLLPAASALLLKPLAEAAGGSPHGVVAFEDTSEAGYAAILAWIEAGELRQ